MAVVQAPLSVLSSALCDDSGRDVAAVGAGVEDGAADVVVADGG